jgi:short chain dehydrogenase
MKLTGKKALITGGNSGIGFATARLFIKEGAQVAITGRNQQTLDAALADLGPNAIGLRGDVTDSKSRKAILKQVAEKFGKSVNSTSSSRTPVSPAQPPQAIPPKNSSKRSSASTSPASSSPSRMHSPISTTVALPEHLSVAQPTASNLSPTHALRSRVRSPSLAKRHCNLRLLPCLYGGNIRNAHR